MGKRKIPGLAYEICYDGELIYMEAYGYADLQNLGPVQNNTVFALASITKQFTADAYFYFKVVISFDALLACFHYEPSAKDIQMINAIIIDDEPNSIKALANDLAEYCPQVSLIKKCASAKEGLKAIRQLQPDLVFLDVNMPWMSGLELLEVVGDLHFDVIFTTAHDQFAVQAFRLSAIDYLLKPIDFRHLITAVKKVEEKHSRITPDHLEHLKENMNPASGLQRIGVPTKSGIDFVLIQEVLYCEADSNYTYVHLTANRKLYSARTLKDFDQLLDSSGFCRIHQSFLINLNHLKKYYRGDGGYVEMLNGASLTVSRSRKEELLSQIRM